MQRKSICESSDTNYSINSKQVHAADVANYAGNRKASVATSGRTPSISSQPRPSLVGILASKRFAKQLSNKAMRKRSSVFGVGLGRSNVPVKEPTYRMVPERKFQPAKVENCIQDVMKSRLEGYRYNPKLSANMCKIIGDEIKFQVKTMNFDRYKIVCSVTIGQRRDQGAQVASRCAWDDNNDNFASFTFKNDSIFCTALVFGVYAE